MADDYLYGLREQQVRNLTGDVQVLRNKNANLRNENAELRSEIERLRNEANLLRIDLKAEKKITANAERLNYHLLGHVHGAKAEAKLLLETLDEKCGGRDKNPMRETLLDHTGKVVLNPAGPREGEPLEARHETYLWNMLEGIRGTKRGVETVGEDWRKLIRDSRIYI